MRLMIYPKGKNREDSLPKAIKREENLPPFCRDLLPRQTTSQESGFTLIELLVVVVIIGILSAIAWPSFLNQANKAKAAEAKTNLGAIVRAQQAYRLENAEFADSLAELGVSVPTKTRNYAYTLQTADDVTSVVAAPADDSVTGYLGLTYVTTDPEGQAQTRTLLCESNTPGAAPPPASTPPSDDTCPAGSDPL